jgi:hypothetical protein
MGASGRRPLMVVAHAPHIIHRSSFRS